MSEFKLCKYLVELINGDKRIITATGYKYYGGMIYFFIGDYFIVDKIVIEFSMCNIISVANIEP